MRSSRHASFAILIALVAFPWGVPAAQAQAATSPAGLLIPGQRLRVKTPAPDANWVVGMLLAVRGDSLALQRIGTHDTIWIAGEGLARLQRSLGRKSNDARGALIGLAIGGGLGMVALRGSCWNCGSGEEVWGAGLIAGVGALLGGMIGSASSSERWVDVWGRSSHLSLSPGLGRIQAGVALRLHLIP
jgi:hypothetical protein